MTPPAAQYGPPSAAPDWEALGHAGGLLDTAGLAALWRGVSTGSPGGTPSPQWVSLLEAERGAWAAGFSRVAGVDEAGRGPLAGPLVAGAALLKDAEGVLSSPGDLAALNDSKQLTESRREALFSALLAGGHALAACVITAGEIDRAGIQPANYGAMALAAGGIEPPPDYLLVDGYNLPGMAQPCCRMVKGDSRSLSIAAASIVAKVVRDRIMLALHEKYPAYGFVNHKGYGTREHLEAIERHGPCPVHRMSFAPLAKAPATGMLFT